MFCLALLCQHIVTSSMLEQNNLNIMGITQWHLRDAIYASAQHNQCYFYMSLVQPLNTTEKTFLIKLYQAIEKLLKLPTSTQLIKTYKQNNVNTSSARVILKFTTGCLTPEIQKEDDKLIIKLPTVSQCETQPAIKSALWKLLKENIL